MKHLVAILLLLAAAPAYAVTFQVIQSDSERLMITDGSTNGTILLNDLAKGTDRQKIDDMLSRLRAMMQHRQLLANLPAFEPTKLANPGLTFGERFFWCDADGNPLAFDASPNADTWVCSQADVIEDIVIDETGAFILHIRNSRDCNEDPTFIACAP